MRTSVKQPPYVRPRGRPRSDKARSAILRATRELLEENGLTALTMEGIAARAEVGKPTVYRWWPDRHAVAMAALMEGEPPLRPSAGEETSQGARQSAMDSLRQQLERVIEVFERPVGRTVARMIAAADADSELSRAFRSHFILERREEGRALLLGAIRQSQIRRDTDIEVALDMIYGALFFRLLMGHAPLSKALPKQILAEAFPGLKR